MLGRKSFYEDINKGTDCYFHTNGSVQILSRKVIEQNILFLFSIKIHRHTQKRQEEWILNVLAAPDHGILRDHSYWGFFPPFLNYEFSKFSTVYLNFKTDFNLKVVFVLKVGYRKYILEGSLEETA